MGGFGDCALDETCLGRFHDSAIYRRIGSAGRSAVVRRVLRKAPRGGRAEPLVRVRALGLSGWWARHAPQIMCAALERVSAWSVLSRAVGALDSMGAPSRQRRQGDRRSLRHRRGRAGHVVQRLHHGDCSIAKHRSVEQQRVAHHSLEVGAPDGDHLEYPGVTRCPMHEMGRVRGFRAPHVLCVCVFEPSQCIPRVLSLVHVHVYTCVHVLTCSLSAFASIVAVHRCGDDREPSQLTW